MKETIIWTAIPAGTSPNGKPMVSAMVTFHLSYTASELASWGGKATLSRFNSVANFKPESIKITVLVNGQPTPATQLSTVQAGMFASLFPPTGPVTSFDPVKPLWSEIRTFDGAELYKHLDMTYGEYSAGAFVNPAARRSEGAFELLNQTAPHEDLMRERSSHTSKARTGAFHQRDVLAGHNQADMSHPTVSSLIKSRLNGKPVVGHTVTDYFAEAQRYHRPFLAGPKPTPLPARPSPDFHDAFAMVCQHRKLMRTVGIVVDFEVSNVPTDGLLSLKVEGFAAGPELLFPSTAFAATATSISSKPRTLDASGGAFESVSRGGFMHMPPAKVGFGQFDLSSAVFQTTNFAEKVALGGAVPAKPRSKGKSNSMALTEPATDSRLPTLRSSGLTAYVSNSAAHILNRLDIATKIVNSNFKEVLTSDDLLKGWRPDVLYKGKWHSLTSRNTFYRVGGQPLSADILDEGQVSAAHSSDPADPSVIKISEGAFTWDGWSLVAPKPIPPLVDRSLKADDTTPDQSQPTSIKAARALGSLDEDANYKLSFFAEPEKGSLPKLRFGETYTFRARYVDLAGNSVPLSMTTMPAETQQTVTYYRQDPITAPSSHTIGKPSPGESAGVLAVRKDASGKVISFGERVVLPPMGGMNFAELHGMFDGADGTPDASFYSKVLVIEGRPKLGETMATPSPAIPYLIDPAATGFTLRIQNDRPPVHEFASGTFVTGSDWIGATTGLIRTQPGSSFGLKAQGNQVDVTLAPGQDVTLHMSCTTSEKHLGVFGQTAWIEKALRNQGESFTRVAKDPDFSKRLDTAFNHRPFGLQHRPTMKVSIPWRGGAQPKSDAETALEACVSGQNEAITPSRSIRCVYAVQVPEPGFSFIQTDVGRYAGTTATFTLHGNVHQWSTSEVELMVAYSDPVDDLTESRRVTHEAHHSAKILDYKPLYIFDKPLDDWYATESLELHDTKAHKVQLMAVCKSRYPDFFPLASRNDFEAHRQLRQEKNGSRFYLDHSDGVVGQYTKTYAKANIIIPSNKKPDPPHVEYLLPVMEWATETVGSSRVSRMRGNTIRVYLRRPWFSSGVDESLGVVLLDGADVDSKFTSAIGYDPAYEYAGQALALTSTNFKGSASVTQGVKIAETGGTATVVAYQPKFDDERQMWFADIEIEPLTGYYTPFVRFALCRFQPHAPDGSSVSTGFGVSKATNIDLRVSPLITTEIAQLQPDRVVVLQTVTPKKQFNLFYTGMVGKTEAGFNAVNATLEQLAYGVANAPWAPVIDNGQPVQFGVALDEGFFGLFTAISNLFEWAASPANIQNILSSANGTSITVPPGGGEYRLVLREVESNGRLCHIDVVNLP